MMTRAIDREVDDVCDLSKGVREKGRAEGLAEGIEKGLAEGIEKGHAEGLTEGQIQMASSIVISLMKTTNKSMNEVLDMADVDEDIRPEVERAVKAMLQSDK